MSEQKQEVQAEVQKENQRTPSIALSEQGQLSPTDHVQLKSVVQTIAQGNGFPKRFDTLPKQIAAYNLSRALMKDRWQLALNNIAEIQGQMTIYGELPRSLAEATKEVKEFKVYVIDKEYKEICPINRNLDAEIYAGVCRVQRVGREPKEYTYTIEEAKKANQYPPMKWDKELRKSVPNPDSPWAKFTKIMLMRKAQAIAVKFDFPDALAGAPVAEYDYDEAPDVAPIKDVTPGIDKARLINEKFSDSFGPVAPANEGRVAQPS